MVQPPPAVYPALPLHLAGPLAEKLHAEIKGLAGRTSGAPVFQPHVTLLGGIHATEADVLRQAQELAARLKVGPHRPTPLLEDGMMCALGVHPCMRHEPSLPRTHGIHLSSATPKLPPLPTPCTLPRQPYRITLDRVSYGSIFHQCVYMLCGTGTDTMQVGGNWSAGAARWLEQVPARWRPCSSNCLGRTDGHSHPTALCLYLSTCPA